MLGKMYLRRHGRKGKVMVFSLIPSTIQKRGKAYNLRGCGPYTTEGLQVASLNIGILGSEVQSFI